MADPLEYCTIQASQGYTESQTIQDIQESLGVSFPDGAGVSATAEGGIYAKRVFVDARGKVDSISVEVTPRGEIYRTLLGKPTPVRAGSVDPNKVAEARRRIMANCELKGAGLK